MKIAIVLILFLGTFLQAEVFVREYTYNASENDSKVSARKAALRQIQLLLIEEVGITVRSQYFKEESLKEEAVSKTINDKYESFSQAITKTKILEQSWNGEKFYIKVEMDIDPNSIAKAIDIISKPIQSKEEVCKSKGNEFRTRLKDLSTQTKISSIIDDAIKHPFTLPCNRWHFDVINKFLRYDIQNKKYKKFLLETLPTISLPAEDQRAAYIIDYLRMDKGITKEEWPNVLAILTRMSTYRMNGMISAIFSRHNKDTLGFLKDFLQMAKEGKIGLPKPFEYSKIASTTIRTLSKQEGGLFEEYYHNYFKDLKPRQDKDLFSVLKGRYMKESTPRRLDLIIAYYTRQEHTEKISDEIYYFLERLEREGENKKIYMDDYYSFIKKTKGLISKIFPLSTHKSTLNDRIAFMLRHNIDSKINPSPQESAKMLFTDDYHDNMRHAHYLALIGERAKPVESKVIKRLRRSERDRFSGTTNMQWDLISILSNIKTENPEAIELLIKTLSSRRSSVPPYAIKALKNIGKPAVTSLIKSYDTQEDYVKIRIIEILSASKKDDEKVIPFLKGIQTKNSWINDALEDALENI